MSYINSNISFFFKINCSLNIVTSTFTLNFWSESKVGM